MAIKSHCFNGRVNSVRCKLFDLGIETRRLFKPLSRQPLMLVKNIFVTVVKTASHYTIAAFIFLLASIFLPKKLFT